ncbi:DUF4194 domain-containing protein [Leucobacter insecticola]|uniref:DUF4194 domain-containing protein n=2 Tax=Leucobacter insecticola TaxID=2714934 RepID=A0A6G8FLR3_9MICO|nr:DUF4194 domain-containing protein [Leucobacter insecticola]
MKGVLYRESNEDEWRTLEREFAAVQDHFSRIGVQVIFDDTNGYAFLKSLPEEEGSDPLPRLVQRRALSYHLSLLLLLLRKRLAEFEAGGEEGRLVLEREQIIEMLRVFLKESSNEVRVIQQVDQTIAQATKLGFLQDLSSKQRADARAWEVKRILKAYVDAEVMGEFAEQLAEYARVGAGDSAADGASDSAAGADATPTPEVDSE